MGNNVGTAWSEQDGTANNKEEEIGGTMRCMDWTGAVSKVVNARIGGWQQTDFNNKT